jgi:hypothetical protein
MTLPFRTPEIPGGKKSRNATADRRGIREIGFQAIRNFVRGDAVGREAKTWDGKTFRGNVGDVTW